MKNNVVVLVWEGSSLSNYLAEKLAEIIIANGLADKDKVSLIYEDNAKEVKPTDIILFENNTSQEIKQAVVYIGTKFHKEITSLNDFAISLTIAYKNAKSAQQTMFSGEQDRALIQAVRIISTVKGEINKTLAKKYNFSQDVVNIIKEVYTKC